MRTAPSAETQGAARVGDPVPAGTRQSGLSLWVPVTMAFCLLLFAWAVFIKVAHSARVESVPLATKGVRP
jgi:hypothetical protein